MRRLILVHWALDLFDIRSARHHARSDHLADLEHDACDRSIDRSLYSPASALDPRVLVASLGRVDQGQLCGQLADAFESLRRVRRGHRQVSHGRGPAILPSARDTLTEKLIRALLCAQGWRIRSPRTGRVAHQGHRGELRFDWGVRRGHPTSKARRLTDAQQSCMQGDYNNVVGFPAQAFFEWLGQLTEEGVLGELD